MDRIIFDGIGRILGRIWLNRIWIEYESMKCDGKDRIWMDGIDGIWMDGADRIWIEIEKME